MLSEVFYWLFNMSVTASVSGGIVLLLRLFRRIPRRAVAVLWCIPFLRMWVPVGMSGKYGLMTILSRFTTRTVTVYAHVTSHDISMTNMVMAADSYFPVTYKVNLVGDVFAVASVIWAIAAGALFTTFSLLYVGTMHEIGDSTRLYDNVYTSAKVTSPSVYGVLRPKIVIPPAAAEDEDLRYILMHENRHVRRLDNLWRICAFATAALHWFNPLSWVFLKCFLSDLEFACDESVLQHCDPEETKRYALALVAFAEHKTLFVSAFGGAKIRTRIERILSYRKMTALSAVVFTALIAAMAYFLLTNAAG